MRNTYTTFEGDAVLNYLEHVAATGNKLEAATRYGISIAAVAARRRDDKEFAELEDWADERFNDKIRAAMSLRGIDGVERDVWYQGQVVGTERVYSDALLKELAKRLPDLKERRELEITTPGILAVPVSSSWDE